MSYNERAIFQAEVAKVEQWWKVYLSPISIDARLTPLLHTGPTLRSCNTPLHCCSGRLEAGNPAH